MSGLVPEGGVLEVGSVQIETVRRENGRDVIEQVKEFLTRGDFTSNSAFLSSLKPGVDLEGYIGRETGKICFVMFVTGSFAVVDFDNEDCVRIVEQIVSHKNQPHSESRINTVLFSNTFERTKEFTKLYDRKLVVPFSLTKGQTTLTEQTFEIIGTHHLETVTRFYEEFHSHPECIWPGQPEQCSQMYHQLAYRSIGRGFLLPAPGISNAYAGMVVWEGPYEAQGEKHVHISRVYMSPDFRGQRLAKPFVSQVCSYLLTSLNVSSIRLRANAQYPTAIALYEKCGFVASPTKAVVYAVKNG
mmetsp:Transcript_10425/g.19458  ORF Transcript_10425/g.19458 Transcript_10425/m.19458 type:complete len:301 (-) Transcript_10425:2213-3115(-)